MPRTMPAVVGSASSSVLVCVAPLWLSTAFKQWQPCMISALKLLQIAVVAIGETYLAQLKPESEIYLIPKIGGGWASDCQRLAAPWAVQSSGSPALRRPAKNVVSNRLRIFGGPK
jgi:hypothetical protein